MNVYLCGYLAQFAWRSTQTSGDEYNPQFKAAFRSRPHEYAYGNALFAWPSSTGAFAAASSNDEIDFTRRATGPA
jgi:hypothetical protein